LIVFVSTAAMQNRATASQTDTQASEKTLDKHGDALIALF